MTTLRPHYLTTSEENLVLGFLAKATPPVPSGFTTAQVALGTGLALREARNTLERLYTKKQIGRQKAMLGADHTAYWLPVAPLAPLELRGPSDDRPDMTHGGGGERPCNVCGRMVRGVSRCSSCRFRGDPVAWEELDELEITVMRLIDSYGDRGLPFTKTQTFGSGPTRAIQGLQRRGIAGVDLQAEVWRFGPKGRSVCDDYKKHNP